MSLANSAAYATRLDAAKELGNVSRQSEVGNDEGSSSLSMGDRSERVAPLEPSELPADHCRY